MVLTGIQSHKDFLRSFKGHQQQRQSGADWASGKRPCGPLLTAADERGIQIHIEWQDPFHMEIARFPGGPLVSIDRAIRFPLLWSVMIMALYVLVRLQTGGERGGALAPRRRSMTQVAGLTLQLYGVVVFIVLCIRDVHGNGIPNGNGNPMGIGLKHIIGNGNGREGEIT